MTPSIIVVVLLTAIIALLSKRNTLDIINITNDLPTNPAKNGRPDRLLSDIDGLTVHHSAGDKWLTPLQIALIHINPHDPNHNWSRIGYHFIIDPNGLVYQTNRLETVSPHAGYEANGHTIGILLMGDFRTDILTESQRKAMKKLSRYLAKKVPSVATLAPHRYYRATSCPVINVQEFADYADLILLENYA